MRDIAFKGISLIELIIVIVLVSILSVYAIPKLNIDNFRETGFSQQAKATIRYAQKLALVTGCDVSVSITAAGCNLSWSGGGCPAATISRPGSTSTNFCPNSTPASTADLPASFSFDKIGRPSAGQSIDLGNLTIEVESETGYTHEL